MTCIYCRNKNIKKVLSDTNSIYTHCESCKGDNHKIYKHLAFDSILKRLLEYLKKSNDESLKIEVREDNGLLSLIINDVNIFENNFKQKLLHKDIYYLENIISDLTKDHYNNNFSDVDILVCA